MIDRDKLDQALRQLGNSADDVAAFLMGQGVKGTRRDGIICPLAVYLRGLFAAPLHVGLTTVSVARSAGSIQLETVAALPDPVASFLEAFDDGCYPDLEAA